MYRYFQMHVVNFTFYYLVLLWTWTWTIRLLCYFHIYIRYGYCAIIIKKNRTNWFECESLRALFFVSEWNFVEMNAISMMGPPVLYSTLPKAIKCLVAINILWSFNTLDKLTTIVDKVRFKWNTEHKSSVSRDVLTSTEITHVK